MPSLYQINQDIMNCLDLETGEIIDAEKLTQLQIAKDEKIENIALWIKNLKADAKALDEEEKAFKARKESTNSKIESLTRLLENELAGNLFSTTKVKISYRKSMSVLVDENATLPEEYLTVKTETSANKKAIGEALKNGVVINGCALVEKQNIQIK